MAKKKEVILPGFDGKTARECMGCGEQIRTKRRSKCKPCWKTDMVASFGPERAADMAELKMYELGDE